MLRVIGDVHGQITKYRRLIKKADYSVQLGDLAFNYDFMRDLDPQRHKFFAGNHDNHTTCANYPNWLGRYGQAEVGDSPFFFVGGGKSIDCNLRTPMVDYWPDEELSLAESADCLSKYLEARPEVVISHECPREICLKIGNPDILVYYGFAKNWSSNTSRLLQAMLDSHVPHIWIHGHMHLSRVNSIRGCTIRSLSELEHVDI